MKEYNFKEIEKKWAEKWVADKTFTPDLEQAKNPYYALYMFPYPSAEGLHIGNFYNSICIDVMAKYKKLNGFDVFEPIGFDAFGIHSENYALKIGETPQKMLERTTANFRNQVQAAGLSCDYTREVNTTKPEYYKWTQWIFTKLFEKGSAFQKEAMLNWCPSCKTVLADEQIINGECERCGTKAEKKKMKQWFFKITDYAQRLLDGLDSMDWSDITKAAQRNWIGRSEGAEIDFQIEGSDEKIKVFTTRPDTLFGATYMVLSPEHEFIKKQEARIKNKEEVQRYIKQAVAKSDLERTEGKEKTGVKLEGIEAINPLNNEKIPVWIADYVLAGYGTGAIMAVPAHDERDFEFAKKYNLPIKNVIEPCFITKDGPDKIREKEPLVDRDAITAIVKHWKDDSYIVLQWKQADWRTFITGGPENGQTMEEAAISEIIEETGYNSLKLIKELPRFHSKFYHIPKKINRFAHMQVFYFELQNDERQDISEIEKERHDVMWVLKENVENFLTAEGHKFVWRALLNESVAFTDDGILANSGGYTGLDSKIAREKITKWLEEKGVGRGVVNYKLRDWCISRQRYWGPPVPIIYCEKCGTIAVPEKDLPVLLPEMEKGWEPAGDGRGPLAKVESFMKTTCPVCGGPAEREADVMDNFLDSAWYFFRYISPNNDKEIFDSKLGKKWLPVDLYVGGNEHAVLHLMYTRFITMALHDLGIVDFDNSFKKFRANGMIQKDGKKMSKSKGNIIKPEDYGEKVGYDALKTYLLFLGPLSEDRSFTDQGVLGCKRWAEKVSRLEEKVNAEHQDEKDIVRKLHQTIKKISEEFEEQKYNTIVAGLMELTNDLSGAEKISADLWKKFLAIIAPFLPALSEELWLNIGSKDSIFSGKNWPEYDAELAKNEEIELVVQINGKLRERIRTDADISEEDAKKLALESEKIKKFLEGKEIRKVIFVKGKLINIVV